MLTIATLGQLTLSVSGVPIQNFRSQKEVALLPYLVHTGQTHNRETLAKLFLAGRTTKQSLANLRIVLARLRKQVPSDELLISRKTVALVSEIYQQLDSISLLRTLAESDELDLAPKVAALHDALKAYKGEFAADFYIDKALGFNDWGAMIRGTFSGKWQQGFRS
ncbi:MAG: hypothetical protein AAF614_30985 [Chloroflexota bacterium]